MSPYEAMRFIAAKGLRPFGNNRDQWGGQFCWFEGEFHRDFPDQVPAALFAALSGGGTVVGCRGFRYYGNQHDALDDLAQAIVATMSIECIAVALPQGRPALHVYAGHDSDKATKGNGRKPKEVARTTKGRK